MVNPVPPASVPELYDECYFGSLSKQAYGPEGAGNPYHRALWFINHQRMRAIASLTGGWGRGRRLLDVGCGPGFFISTARDFGWDPTGVEISSVAAGFGARSYGLEILQGDLLDLDLPSRSFDVITMWHLLEHLQEPMATLRLARQLLREGGWLVVEVPNLESLFSRLTARPYRGAAHPRFHRQSFSHRTLERALRRICRDPPLSEHLPPGIPLSGESRAVDDQARSAFSGKGLVPRLRRPLSGQEPVPPGMAVAAAGRRAGAR